MRRVVAIVDGEHYPPVVRAALEEIEDVVLAAVLVGGIEKLRGDDQGYGVPLERSVETAVERYQPDVVLDLSDEPVLGPRELGELLVALIVAHGCRLTDDAA